MSKIKGSAEDNPLKNQTRATGAARVPRAPGGGVASAALPLQHARANEGAIRNGVLAPRDGYTAHCRS